LDKKRKSLWLGAMSKRAADSVARHVDELVRAKGANTLPDADSAKWAAGLEGRLRETLCKWGLIETRKEIPINERTVGAFFDTYIAGLTDLEASTRNKYTQASSWFTVKVGREKLLQDVTPAEIDHWRRWMLQEGLAQATANKHAKRIKKLFSEAVRARVIEVSPAVDQRIGGEVNRDRDHYISRSDAVKILKKCDTEWAMIFSLCRFAGFRCPTEITALRWSDIQWDENRLRIDSKKTGLRFCPIFPALRPYLEAALNEASEHELMHNHHCVKGHRTSESNLRTQLKRIVESAGLVQWQKPFVNLRASCRTDLDDRFPGHVVDSWLGHSSAVARKHYQQVTDDHWARASADEPETVGGPIGGPTSGPIHALPDASRKSGHKKTPGKPGSDASRGTVNLPLVPPQGLEPWTNGLRVRCSTN
tara:strand:- start:14008 stop:15270 length:1263 start_codon:yes stop_codon:yes gene_type:complete